ncbi:hypothetical protein KJA15_01775 [Patescibacteria group bacterium]|nr:hypothetical protein [Patescibacteria group bacterium]
MKLEPKRKIYLSLAIFGIITILLIVLIIYPFFEEIKKNSKELISQKKRQISLQEEIKSFKEIESLYKTYQSNIEKIDDLFAEPEAPIEFINFLEKNAEKSQLSIEISPMAEKETGPWPSLFFQISTIGSFSNFLKFLEKLETGPYLIEISNLNVRKITEKELRVKRFETFSLSDTNALFLIKVLTK